MKSLEHTIRDLLERKGSDSVSFDKQLILFIEQNAHTGKSKQELVEEFMNLPEGAAAIKLLTKAASSGAAKSSPKAAEELASKVKELAKQPTPKARTTPDEVPPGKVIEFPKKAPETPAKPGKPAEKTPETPAKPAEKPVEKPAETPATPAKPVEKTPEKPAETPATPSKPAEAPSTAAKPDAKPDLKAVPKDKSTVSKLGSLAAGAGLGSLVWNALKKLLNPGSGGGGTGVSMPGTDVERHRAGVKSGLGESTESPGTIERKKIENVARPKLSKLKRALGDEDKLSRQGSIKTKTVDESTEEFLNKVKKARAKDKQKTSFEKPVKETNTVKAAGDLNKESPDR